MKKILLLIIFSLSLLFSGCYANDPVTETMYFHGGAYVWDGTAWQPVSTSNTGNVTSSLVIANNTVVRGDGGVRGIQDSLVTVGDFGQVYTPGDIDTDSDINVGNQLNVTDDIDCGDNLEVGGHTELHDYLYIIGGYPISWRNLANDTTLAYFMYDGNLTLREVGEGNLIIEADTGNITADSYVELRGDARVYNATWVDAGGIKSPGAKPALAIAHGTLETPAWQFDDATEINEESVSFSIRIPERMDRSEESTLTLGWSSTTTSGNCTWQLEYFWSAPDEDTTVGAEETLTVTTLSSATAEGKTLTTFTGINAPSSTDVCLYCRLKRKSGSATDTITDTVELHGICFRWISDKIGGKI